jgi:hypothetical protein
MRCRATLLGQKDRIHPICVAWCRAASRDKNFTVYVCKHPLNLSNQTRGQTCSRVLLFAEVSRNGPTANFKNCGRSKISRAHLSPLSNPTCNLSTDISSFVVIFDPKTKTFLSLEMGERGRECVASALDFYHRQKQTLDCKKSQ